MGKAEAESDAEEEQIGRILTLGPIAFWTDRFGSGDAATASGFIKALVILLGNPALMGMYVVLAPRERHYDYAERTRLAQKLK